MADDTAAIAALYENVGLGVAPANDQAAVAALYENVGIGFFTWRIGVVRFRIDDSYGVAALYEDVT